MVRYAVRFWGTLDAFLDLLTTTRDLMSGAAAYSTGMFLRQLQAASMLLYHPLEHATWLQYVAPGLMSDARTDLVERLVCGLACVWAAAGLAISQRRVRTLQQEQQQGQTGSQSNPTPVATRSVAIRDARLRSAIYVAELLLGINWTIDLHFSDGTIGSLGLFGALAGGYLKWKSLPN
jgi:hypothetical protein